MESVKLPTKCVSILLFAQDSDHSLEELLETLGQQPECLELIVIADESLGAGSKSFEFYAGADPRIRIISATKKAGNDPLTHAIKNARGTFIGSLDAGDFYEPGSLARAVIALQHNPRWLMVYGDGIEYSANEDTVHRYPKLHVSHDSARYSAEYFIRKSTVIFRRSMGLLLATFCKGTVTDLTLDYWLLAFRLFGNRIGYIPHLQAHTRRKTHVVASTSRTKLKNELREFLAAHFGAANVSCMDIWNSMSSPVELENDTSKLSLHESRVECNGICSWKQTNMPRQSFSPLVTSHDSELLITCSEAKKGFLRPQANEARKFSQKPFGVNLIGHAYEIFGVGEDVRSAARAFQAAEIPCCVIHYPAENGASLADRSIENLLCEDQLCGPYAFNLICMAAPIHSRWLQQKGYSSLLNSYTIASWPWETQTWPEAWHPLLDVTDEIWPSSHFTAAAFASPAVESKLPIHVFPMAAEVSDSERFSSASMRAETRSQYGLSHESVIFCYSFDFKSTAGRKNPVGALEAFQLAFPLPHLPTTFRRKCGTHDLSSNVALLIKTLPHDDSSAEWRWLQARAAEDTRICLVAASLAKNELMALYGCCDVFLSLHRSEGFGRGIAEALQLGLDVIATDFGGNTDFCTGPLAHPVHFRKVLIPKGAYPFASGHHWAEPDLMHAAEICRDVARRRLKLTADTSSEQQDPSRDPDIISGYRKRFSFEVVGARYKNRLSEIWRNRQIIEKQLRWQ